MSTGKLPSRIVFSTNLECSAAMLQCGVHKCPRSCHYRSDHSKMNCDKIVDAKCLKGHGQKRKCYEAQPSRCKLCELEDQRDDRILERDMQLQDKRLRDQVKHDIGIADLEMQIEKIREELEDKKMAQERARALEQKKRDLDAARRQAIQPLQQDSEKTAQDTRPSPSTSVSASDNDPNVTRQPGTHGRTTFNTSSGILAPTALNKSISEFEWERQKRVEGASDGAIDDLMLLTGLEDVKMKMLDIKAKIETVARQGIDMKKERMGMVMLGNPGTGMLYGSHQLYY